ncbi:MAG: hypothetical protein ACKVP4_03200 [Hyphomicrobium sp.]
MKSGFVLALAAAVGMAGLVAVSHEADARKLGGGGGGMSMGKMGGGSSRMSGMRMSSPRMSGPRFSSQRFSGQRFSGQRFSGPRIASSRRSNGNWNGIKGSNKKWANGNWNGNRNGRHRGHKRRFYAGYPYYWAGPLVYSQAYSYGDDCGWLHRKAIQTGSSYWWTRYNECRLDY